MKDNQKGKRAPGLQNRHSKNLLSGTDRLPKHSLTQEELKYMCNQGGKTTPSYVDQDMDPGLEV
ncbi:MAG: hypothetical protein ACM3NT_03060 [Methylocystaceae bacterium]